MKRYDDYHDMEYEGIRDVGNLFNPSIDKYYYKSIEIVNGFDNKNNYIEYESKGDKDKILSIIKFLNIIRSYLGDIIQDH